MNVSNANSNATQSGSAPISARVYTKPSAAEIRKKLTPMQLNVTQEEGTEPPFRNAYFDHHEAGIYVDIVTGEPLFSSQDKFDSGTGWPSFVRPLEASYVINKTDSAYGMVRVEVRSKIGDSHLGHVFDDGPAPTGKRYCINSASLRFIPVAQLEAEGYGAYASAFTGPHTGLPLPAATNNACAIPKPDHKVGCATTLETVILAGDEATETRLRAIPGVLEIDAGSIDSAKAVRVVYDPVKVNYATLLESWSANDKAPHTIYAPSDEQKLLAQAFSERVGRKVTFVSTKSDNFAAKAAPKGS